MTNQLHVERMDYVALIIVECKTIFPFMDNLYFLLKSREWNNSFKRKMRVTPYLKKQLKHSKR